MAIRGIVVIGTWSLVFFVGGAKMNYLFFIIIFFISLGIIRCRLAIML